MISSKNLGTTQFSNIEKIVGAGMVILGLNWIPNAFAKDSNLDLFNRFMQTGEVPSSLVNPADWDHLSGALLLVQKHPKASRLLGKPEVHALRAMDHVFSSGVETVKFQHFYKGIPVAGSVAFHHSSVKGRIVQEFLSEFDLEVKPTLTQEEAVGMAQALTRGQPIRALPELKILPNSAGSARLVYWVNSKGSRLVPSHEIWIDAHSGNIIADISSHYDLDPVEVYSASSNRMSIDTSKKMSNSERNRLNQAASSHCQVIDQNGWPLITLIENCNQTVTDGNASSQADDSSQRALSNSEAVLSYYQNNHSRNSYDGNGSNLISIVHSGDGMDNAFWDVQASMMNYGDGDRKTLGDFTLALDVAGHEMTHGVTHATAQLIHMDESGAIDEANSDFFGKMVANDGTWTMGAALFLNQDGNAAIRDLANPARLQTTIRDEKGNPQHIPYPTRADEKIPSYGTCEAENDLCWVHANSTIISHARYLVAKAIGNSAAEKLYYAVLVNALPQNATFQIEASSARQMCSTLGMDSSQCQAVDQAYSQVGL